VLPAARALRFEEPYLVERLRIATNAVILGATGQRLNPEFYHRHLMARYVNKPF
jgi:hypothetical protein